MMHSYLQDFRALPRAQRWMVAVLAIVLILAQINQPYWEVAPIHHLPTLLLLIAAPLLLSRWPLSNGSVACIFLFFLLHTLGARYTYTDTPYDQWAMAISGHDVSSIFGWQRNHYDRLVHFSFGLTMLLPFVEIDRRYFGTSLRAAVFLSLQAVLAVGALYELFEWLLAVLIGGVQAELYNGQQGDAWDSQKDMLLAFVGALLSSLIMLLAYRLKHKKLKQEG